MLAGLEIHQRLEERKLFCECAGEGRRKFRFRRHLRAVRGIGGRADRAAVFESQRYRLFEYEGSERICLVEMDEEPPHPPSESALKKALAIGIHFNYELFDETVVMRKIVVDGSDTTGFQRTMLLGIDGRIGDVGLQTLCLEEESAGILAPNLFDLHRLSIPLVELATEPMEEKPERIKEIALFIGREMRKLGVLRGLGTIRQDLNVSIEGGARVEIKGVQTPDLIPKVIEIETNRQRALIEISEQLKERGATVGEIIKTPKLFKSNPVYLMRLDGFSDLLGQEVAPGRRFGTEISDYAKAMGAGGIMHSDERDFLGLSEIARADSWIAVAHPRGREILERLRGRLLYFGVPEETRRALPNGNTAFMRPLPGRARMYPETDLIPVRVCNHLDAARRYREERLARWRYLDGLPEADAMERAGHADLYVELRREGLSPKEALSLAHKIPRTLASKGIHLTSTEMKWLVKQYKEGRLTLKGLEAFAERFNVYDYEAFRRISGNALRALVKEMGKDVFKQYRLRVDAQEVFNYINEIGKNDENH